MTSAPIVRTTHSACVLSEEVLERSRLTVRAFYGAAAEQPQAELCCPVRPDEADLAHIPREVVERFYGCGSPVTAAALVPGETMVDLGSGAGIDCFIAAKKLGPEGHVFGVDMTDQMLTVARESQPKVAAALGFDVVEFHRGFLEDIPVSDATADVVTSNCVINLSPDKPRVFREIWRVLKDHGRAVIADIVSDRDVPPKMRADGQLWGECISGALTEEAFLAALERAGFYGVGILKQSFWKEVQGCRFYSITVRGYKFEKKAWMHLRRAVCRVPRPVEGCHRRGRASVSAGHAGRGVHRYRQQAVARPVRRIFRHRRRTEQNGRHRG